MTNKLEEVLEKLVRLVWLSNNDGALITSYRIKATSELNTYIQDCVERSVVEARIDEWSLIHETLHSATLEEQAHIDKVMDNRISQLRGVTEDKK